MNPDSVCDCFTTLAERKKNMHTVIINKNCRRAHERDLTLSG